MRYYTLHDVLFIHIPKTAGTSLIKFLDSELGGYVLIMGGRAHLTLDEVYKDLVQDSTNIFAVIRNPFDIAVSLYEFFKISADADTYPHKKLAKSYKFDAWLEKWYKDNHKTVFDYLTVDGDVPKNLTVIKFESLQKDLSDFFNGNLGFNIDFSKMQRLNKTKHRPWQNYYNKVTSEIIKEKSHWALKKFYPELL